MAHYNAIAAYALALIEREVYWTPAKVMIDGEEVVTYGLDHAGKPVYVFLNRCADQLSIIGALDRAREVITRDRRAIRKVEAMIEHYSRTWKLPSIYDLDYKQCVEVLTFVAQH